MSKDVALSVLLPEDLRDRIETAAGSRRISKFLRDSADLRLGLQRLGLPDRLDELAAALQERQV